MLVVGAVTSSFVITPLSHLVAAAASEDVGDDNDDVDVGPERRGES